MISAGEFRNGVTFEMDGQVMQVARKAGKGLPLCSHEDEERHHRRCHRNLLQPHRKV